MANGTNPVIIRTAEDGNFYERELYKLLHKAFPQYRTKQDILDVPMLCAAFPTKRGGRPGMSAEGVYKWLRSDSLSPEGARKLIELSKGKLTKENLLPFVLG